MGANKNFLRNFGQVSQNQPPRATTENVMPTTLGRGWMIPRITARHHKNFLTQVHASQLVTGWVLGNLNLPRATRGGFRLFCKAGSPNSVEHEVRNPTQQTNLESKDERTNCGRKRVEPALTGLCLRPVPDHRTRPVVQKQFSELTVSDRAHQRRASGREQCVRSQNTSQVNSTMSESGHLAKGASGQVSNRTQRRCSSTGLTDSVRSLNRQRPVTPIQAVRSPIRLDLTQNKSSRDQTW